MLESLFKKLNELRKQFYELPILPASCIPAFSSEQYLRMEIESIKMQINLLKQKDKNMKKELTLKVLRQEDIEGENYTHFRVDKQTHREKDFGENGFSFIANIDGNSFTIASGRNPCLSESFWVRGQDKDADYDAITCKTFYFHDYIDPAVQQYNSHFKGPCLEVDCIGVKIRILQKPENIVLFERDNNAPWQITQNFFRNPDVNQNLAIKLFKVMHNNNKNMFLNSKDIIKAVEEMED